MTQDDDPDPTSSSILFRENPHLLQVTQEDITKCYSFANRVGMKWADELKRQGCVEFSDIVLQIVNRGHYLEPNISSSRSGGGSSDNKTAGETPDNNDTNWKKNINDNPNADNNKFATSHAALHSLRRYEPDCDGSGKPSKYLRPILRQDDDDNNNNDSSSTTRKIIHQIDEMARNGQTSWYHGWDAIEEAVKRNRKRIVYSRCNEDDEEMKERTKSKEGKGTKKRVHFEGGDPKEQTTDDEGEVSKKRRVYDEESDAEYNPTKSGTVNKPDETIRRDRGRPPSSIIGDTVYSWEGILHSMSSQERRNLIVSSIHPPHPFEETDDVDNGSDLNQPTATTDKECGVNVVGALKEVGLIHLYEQTRHLPREETDDVEETEPNNFNGLESFLGASETRASFKSQQLNRMKKKSMRRAEKERLGSRAPVMGEKNADYYGFGTVSGKVKLTEGDQSLSTNTKREAPTGNMLSVQIHDEPERQRWLEFDLGECFLEEVEEDSNYSEGTSSAQENKKRVLAFRSLEMAIMD